MNQRDIWRSFFGKPLIVGDILISKNGKRHRKYVLMEIDQTFSHPYLLRFLKNFKEDRSGAWYSEELMRKYRFKIIGHKQLKLKKELDGQIRTDI